MNDAERDAWLREALRHAPDADAVPPSGISEAILSKARAQARVGTPARGAPTRVASKSAFATFWDWLARPPVAAGFASVMAATLVGLMWWDQPMDETMPRPPAVASERNAATPPLASTAPETVAAPPAPRIEAAKATPAAPANETAKLATDDSDLRRRQRSELKQSAAADAKLAEPADAPEKRKGDPLAKERSLTAEAKNEAPAPFPAAQAEVERSAEAARKTLAAPANDFAKKTDGTSGSHATDALERAATPSPARSIAPAPAQADRPVPPTVAAAPAARPPPSNVPTAPPAAPAPATATAATAPREASPAPFSEFAQRQRAPGELRDKDTAGAAASASAPPPPAATAPSRDDAQRARLDKAQQADATPPVGAIASAEAPTRANATARADARARAGAAVAAAPLGRVLAAIAAEPERWSRRKADGQTVALDAGSRAWLTDVDAAATGRWRPLDPTAAGASTADSGAARDGAVAPGGTGGRDDATTLRLLRDGRLVAVVRIDGNTVTLDAAPGTNGERWQAALSAAGADRLRTTSRRLLP